MKKVFIIMSLYILLGGISESGASERRFTYTYESAVLAPGEVEFEPWTTARIGRDDYYARYDNRLEFEFGLTPALQTAFYVNYKTVTAETEGVRETESEFDGISWEWKYKVKDPVADAFGFALYLESSFGYNEVELEAKTIFDKRIGKILTAGNVVYEREWEWEDGVHIENTIVLVGGASYFVSNAFAAGAELRNVNIIPEGEELESSTIFAGPSLSYVMKRWWAALSVLPQIYSPKNDTNETLDLVHRERLEARLLLGAHF